MATESTQTAVPATAPGAGNASGCQTRKLGTDLVVCLEGKACTFAVPYGYLAFCKHPNMQRLHKA